MAIPNALAIAGFDPSGGAGVLADARTFAALGFRPSAVITSITFQNDKAATGAVHQTGEAVGAQLSVLTDEFHFACVKVGMLPTREVMNVIGRVWSGRQLPAPVVDPVMASSSGMRLMEPEALEVFIEHIMPLARLVTPNIPEAETLSGMSITSEAEMRKAAAAIRGLGARAVLIKGGHLCEEKAEGKRQEAASNQEAIDLLDDDGRVRVFRAQFIAGAKLRGSGCVLSSAIAAGLGKGTSLEYAVSQAKDFVLRQLADTAKP